ncbi:hypothetical protein [Candidatus Amarobacter glycogenicus]|uniref:hypothetical protein n=1 Tax=Candidatus Amarobacter glycogenicus TaxID=3140699 RepID=UPI0031CCCCB4
MRIYIPVWQRQIGFWLPTQFPGLQFIVATHSPFIPQAADENAVFVLRPDDTRPRERLIKTRLRSRAGARTRFFMLFSA